MTKFVYLNPEYDWDGDFTHNKALCFEHFLDKEAYIKTIEALFFLGSKLITISNNPITKFKPNNLYTLDEWFESNLIKK